MVALKKKVHVAGLAIVIRHGTGKRKLLELILAININTFVM